VINTVCVYGLWHLGSVTAACLASAGVHVVGLDPDPSVVTALARGEPPVAEPGLPELIQEGLSSGRLEFESDPGIALPDASIVWVTFDTPVDDEDRGDPGWVRTQIEQVRPYVRKDVLILISSQVPVGFTRALEQDWRSTSPGQTFACSPENLRLGRAIEVFRNPGRVVVGRGRGADRECLRSLFALFCDQIEWMSLESAEMSKHALNAYLALSVAYANELARISERVGADAKELERSLRTDPRVGEKAYVSPGAPIAGGTLVRDVEFLRQISRNHGLASPLIGAIHESNQLHMNWARERLMELLSGSASARVALLGLTYKPGTDTLRRSSSVELGKWLLEHGLEVRAFDPAIHSLPADLHAFTLASSLDEALQDTDAAVVATPWPEFKALSADRFVAAMRSPRVVDQAGFLPYLADDARLTYVRVGRPMAELAM
jgi:UDPglucose 6-dehydrogenase